MKYKDNFLDSFSLKYIKHLIDTEIQNDVCLDVPLFQSYGDMQIRHKDDLVFSNFLANVLDYVNNELSANLVIDKCWFNICKSISKYTYHDHHPIPVSAVFYLEGCTNNGTIFRVGDAELQTICDDNSLLVFDGGFLHKVPSWKGQDRYSIAFDFSEGA
jgi:hypothetical protein